MKKIAAAVTVLLSLIVIYNVALSVQAKVIGIFSNLGLSSTDISAMRNFLDHYEKRLEGMMGGPLEDIAYLEFQKLQYEKEIIEKAEKFVRNLESVNQIS